MTKQEALEEIKSVSNKTKEMGSYIKNGLWHIGDEKNIEIDKALAKLEKYIKECPKESDS